MTYYTRFRSPLCDIIIVGSKHGLQQLHLCTEEGHTTFYLDPAWQRKDDFFTLATTQLQQYFAGQRQRFDLPLNPRGTPFQRRVWQELTHIAYGELRSYKEIAHAIGNPNAARAVGLANSKNPLPIIIPCHRVIGANGQLTGFSAGLKIKQQLIRLEQTGSPA